MIRSLTPMKWFVVLVIIAVGVALGLPPDPQAVRDLHTSPLAYRLAVALLLVPYVLIWYMGFYAYAKLKEYSDTIKNTSDGEAFRKLTLGMGVLAFSLIVPTILSLVSTNIAAHNHGFKNASIIINNYLTLYPGLVSFLLIFNGTRPLVRTLKDWGKYVDIRWHAPWFLLLGIVFSYLTIHNHYRSQQYHLGVPLLITTIIVPYVYAWLVGLLAAYELNLYAKRVRGTIYKRAMRLLSRGLAVAITGSIAIQFVNVTLLQSVRDDLGALLLVDYVLILIVLGGLLLISLGTRKLKKIEEV